MLLHSINVSKLAVSRKGCTKSIISLVLNH